MVGKLTGYRCNDGTVKELYNLVKQRKLAEGKEVLKDGKSYFVNKDMVYSSKTDNLLGEVKKRYSLNSNDEWMLTSREVINNRGRYHRFANLDGTECVSLGGQVEFELLPDGSYFQRAFANHPARFISSNEIEAAIDYVKGCGAAENYKKLFN